MQLNLRRLGGIGIAVALTCSAAFMTTGDESVAKAESAKARHENTTRFWTNARVRKAIPRDFVYNQKSHRFERKGPGGSTTIGGASWTAGGEVLKTTGKVLFAMGGSYWVCSASVVDDAVADRSIILTAGHCAYDEVALAFATNWMFVPEYDTAPTSFDSGGQFCATTVHGCWTASSLVVHNGYASAGGFNNTAIVHDFAFAVVGAGGKSGTAQLDTTVGGHPIQFSSVAANADTYLFGYPASGAYKGKDLVYCRGKLGFDSRVSNLTYKVGCNMTGGASGGPWFSPFAGGSGTIMSLNSYGYGGVSAMYGPKLNSKTQTMFGVAGTAVANTIVS